LAWSTLVTILSLQPPSGGISLAHGFDKIVHTVFYVPFSLLALYHPRRGFRPALLLFLFAANFGFLMELLQKKIPGRSFEWADLVADLAGAALGLLIFGLGMTIQRRGECRE